MRDERHVAESKGMPQGRRQEEKSPEAFDRDRFFTLAAAASFDAIVIHENGKILFVNKTLTNLLGYERSELIGQSVLGLVNEESRYELLRRIQTDSSVPYEVEGERKNGSHFIGEIRAKSICMDGRNFRLAAVRDITERRKKERALSKEAEVYRQGQAAILKLVKSLGLAEDEVLHRVTETAARVLNVERVGLWMFAPEARSIRVTDLYIRGENTHSDDMELRAQEFPAYFAALANQRVIAAHDALNDGRTLEMADSYLKPLGIGAMLDVPVWQNGKAAGILCLEHVGSVREWTQAEQQLGVSLADVVSLLLESRARKGVEEELRKSEEHLRLITSQMPALVWTTDRELRVTSGAGSGLSPLYVSPVPHGENLFELLQSTTSGHPLVRPQLSALEGESLTYDGEWQGRYYQVHIEPFRNATGEIIGTIGLAQDISERKRAEDEMRLLHDVATAMTLADDTDSALNAALETICRKAGWEVGQVWVPNGQHTRLVPSGAYFVSDQALLEFRAASQQLSFGPGEGNIGCVWQSKTPSWVQNVADSLKYTRQAEGHAAGLHSALAVPVLDGNEVVAVLDFHMYGQRLEDEHMVRLVSSAASQLGSVLRRKDLEAERKLLYEKERALAEEASRRATELQTVLDNIVDAVFVYDKTARLTMLNESARRLVAAAGLAVKPGMRVSDLGKALGIISEDAGESDPHEPVRRVLRGETLVELEMQVNFKPSGKVGIMRINASPIRNAAGEITGGVGVARDVTKQEDFARMKDSFISVTAHELKTPLSIMKGYAQAVLRAKAEFPPTYRKMLEAIDTGANRIVRLLDDLLEVSRKGSISINADAQDAFDLAACVRETVQRHTLASRETVRIVHADSVFVKADRGRIEQVITNLLSNALKYSPAGGEISLDVTRVGGEAVVSVADRGIGIPAEKQPQMFQRFFRAHANTPQDVGGMGVGLFISKEIVTKHGGRIWFKSKEGEGSTFCFALPVARP